MPPLTERRLLQGALLLLACSPLGVGAAGALGGLGFAGASVDVSSHARYLSGIFFTLGVLLLTLVPRIEREGRLFGWLCAAVIVGGLARLLGAAGEGWPSWPHRAALVLELGVTPLMWAWQRRVAGRHVQEP